MSKAKLGGLLLGLWLAQSFAWYLTHADAQTLPTQCVASAIAGGTANVITISALPCATTTNLVIVTASAANTTAVTLQVIGQTLALPVVKGTGSALVAGDIPGANYRMQITPTGTSWILLNPATAGTVTSVTCGSGVTCTPNPITGAGTITSTSLGSPGGRLTLVSATPVLTSDQTGKGTIFYDTFLLNTVPVAGVAFTIPADELSLILDVTNHTSGHLYDVFGYASSGTLALCAGPAWTNTTTRSQAIALSGGVWTNSGSMTNCFNNSVNVGPLASHAGTYLGTFYATANGQTGMSFAPSAASGGTNNILGLFNAYNRVPLAATCRDSTASWTYATHTWQGMNNSSAWRVSFVDGLQQVNPVATLNANVSPGDGSTYGGIGVVVDSVSATPTLTGQTALGVNASAVVVAPFPPLLGLHAYQAMQFAAAGHTATFNSNNLGTADGVGLVLQVGM